MKGLKIRLEFDDRQQHLVLQLLENGHSSQTAS